MRTDRILPVFPRIAAIVTLITLVAVVGACTRGGTAGSASAVPNATASPTASPTTTAVPEPTPVPAATPTRGIPQVSLPPVPGIATDIPQDILAAIFADAAARTGAATADITVISANAETWPNGALGCAKPGFGYTDRIEPGFQVVVGAAGTRLDYRVGSGGTPQLCEKGPGQS